MKKLTAGILTVMLGIVAANSADASIASRGYVDAQVGTKVATSDFNTFKTENEAAIAEAKKAGTDASAALETYKTTASDTFATKTALSDGLATKQNKLTAGTNIKIEDNGTISTVGIATTEGLTALETTVAGHTTQLGTLTGNGEGSVAKSIADAISGEVNRANAAYATAAQGEKADTAVQPSQIADMETKTDAAATYATKDALTAVDNKFGNYTTTTGMNDALALKADKSTIGEVESGKTVVQMITEAKNAASGETTALAGRVDTIENGAVMQSGITAEKVTQIETNKTAVEAVTNDLATNYTKTSALSALAKADIPATCTDPKAANGCALILKNGVYSWEVVERDASENNN